MPTATSLPMTCTATMVTASHWVGLTLPGMMEEPGSFSGNVDFAQTVPGAGGQPAHVVGNLHHVAGGRLDGAVREDQLVLGGQRVELVGRGHETACRSAAPPASATASRRSPWGRSGRCRRRCRPAPVPSAAVHGQLQQLRVPLQRGAPAADLLAELDGRRILQMGTAGLDDALVLRLQAA